MPIHSRPPEKTSGYFFTHRPNRYTGKSTFAVVFGFLQTDFRSVQGHFFKTKEIKTMEFFNSAVDVLKTLVVALGAGLGVWGAVNLMEGYGGDNPSAKSQGMKQLMAGGGVALIGITLVPLLSGLFG